VNTAKFKILNRKYSFLIQLKKKSLSFNGPFFKNAMNTIQFKIVSKKAIVSFKNAS